MADYRRRGRKTIFLKGHIFLNNQDSTHIFLPLCPLVVGNLYCLALLIKNEVRDVAAARHRWYNGGSPRERFRVISAYCTDLKN